MSVGPQDQWEQLDAFSFDIQERIEFFRREFDIPLEGMVGVLEVAKIDLANSIDVDFTQDFDPLSDDSED